MAHFPDFPVEWARDPKMRLFETRTILGLDLLNTTQDTVILQFDKLVKLILQFSPINSTKLDFPQDPSDCSRQFRCELRTSHEKGKKPFEVVSALPQVDKK